MDIFSTAATACQIIYQTLDSSAAFPSESRALAARFRYDARILRHFCDYFQRHIDAKAGLDKEDQDLLEESTAYLAVLLNRVEVCKTKLAAGSRWARELNRITWALRRNEMKELEKELYEWTRRLDLRLVALPERARTVMSAGPEEEVKTFTPRLAARIRLERFAATSPAAKEAIWERLVEDSSRYEGWENPSSSTPFSLAAFEDQYVVREFRNVPLQIAHDQNAWKAAQTSLGEFAAALNCLDSTVSGLLKCRAFFYQPTPKPAFCLLYSLPPERQANGVLASFKDILRVRDSKGRRQKLRYSLNQRLEFARKLATAVFFVHSIGWVHKAIRSQNVLVLGREAHHDDKTPRPPTWSIGSPYLVGFGVARSDDAETVPGTRLCIPLEVSLYLHPSLQDGAHMRCTMAHDVYSFGVVLLELGLWAPLEERAELRGDMKPGDVAEILFKLANEVEILMGRKYREIVQACLSHGCEGDTGNIKSISEALEKLEDLSQSV